MNAGPFPYRQKKELVTTIEMWYDFEYTMYWSCDYEQYFRENGKKKETYIRSRPSKALEYIIKKVLSSLLNSSNGLVL